MIEKKDEKEAQELKKVYNHYLNKRTDFMEKTQIKNKDSFSELIGDYASPPDQILKLNTFPDQNHVLVSKQI